MIKIWLSSENGFFPETVEFYQSFAKLVSEEEAEIIVINDFTPIETDKVVACNSTGLDHIKALEVISLRGEDLSEFTAVPELCLAMSIGLLREERMELKDKNIGIIGAGRIGLKFAEYLKALGAQPWLYDRQKLAFDLGFNWSQSLEAILRDADVVSLHITADEENRGWFNKEKFEQIKDGAILLNSSRPWLVETEALKWALDNKLGGAWFDFNMPFSHEKLHTTPHLGGTTIESRRKSEMIIAKKIKKLYG